MHTLSGRERIGNILRRQPVDRIGFFEHFWSDTRKTWESQGHIQPEEDLATHFGFDMELYSPFNLVADLDFEPQVIEETDETILTRDGNGALLRRHKLHDATPEHVDFAVHDRATWEALAKPKLIPDARRIRFAEYRAAKERARAQGRFFAWSGVHAFELMKDLAGHVFMLQGMALDPDWVRDMVMTYARLSIALQEELFSREGLPDGIWYYEDMGFKAKPFMSPRMYREIMQPGHALTFDYAHSLGLPVIVHSCGYVEPLLPGMIAAGMDALQVLEVKAGMDPVKLHAQFGDKIALIGGIDVRTLYTNDRAVIDAELEAKVPALKQGYNYVLHSDHSIPNTVEYDTFRYYIQRGLELGRYD